MLQEYWSKTVGPVDKLLDRITSFRLVLYYLIAIVAWGVVMAFFHNVSYSWYSILSSAGILVGVTWLTGYFCSKFLNIYRNHESDLITALILTPILAPADNIKGFAVLAGAGFAASISKYILTIWNRHIFNPAAIGAFTVAHLLHQYPSWWVGTKSLTVLVFFGGLLILRKTQRFVMVGLFLAVFSLIIALTVTKSFSLTQNYHVLWRDLIVTPVLFFAVVMLIEPLTSPYELKKYLPYTALVASCYSFTKLKLAPEEALLVGNILAFLLAPTKRLALSLINSRKEADGIYTYMFQKPKKFRYKAGQFMEWTVPTRKSDSRGNRRYLTLSSSPNEDYLGITVKMPSKHSAFKSALTSLKPGDKILASHMVGSFVLPEEASKKIVLLAGGVGITPFRSMVKTLSSLGQKRDISLLYSAANPKEIAFYNDFKEAKNAGLKTYFDFSDTSSPQPNWPGFKGKLTKDQIATAAPDYQERLFYISGPYGFVQSMKVELAKLGVSKTNIKSDYFPGYG